MLGRFFTSAALFAAAINAQFPGCKNNTLVDKNPSFESGLKPWAVSGGAKRVSASDTTFKPTNGKYYIKFTSNPSTPAGTLTQDLGGIDYYGATLEFDWAFEVSTSGHGPPGTTCSLTSTFGDSQITQWVRDGGNGGRGHSAETLGVNTGGNLTFTFSCSPTSSTFTGNAAVDNIRFTKICGYE